MKKLYQEKIAPFLYTSGDCVFIQNYKQDKYARIWHHPDLNQRGQQLQAHRVTYQVFHGEIPERLFIMHSCNKKGCVNPAHLSAGTNQQNQLAASKDGLHPLGGTGIRGVSSTFKDGKMKYKAVTSGRPRKILYFGPSLEKAIEARKNWENG